jgi:hypothetical protein
LTTENPQADKGASVLKMEDRRRSQRVIIQVPVTVQATVAGEKISLSAQTVSVNTHGAMILCPRSFDADTVLVVVNDRTRGRATARVTRAPRESQGKHLVPVEFDQPAPTFWQISFPPANWKPVEI